MVCQRLVLLMSKSRPKWCRWAAIYECVEMQVKQCAAQNQVRFLGFHLELLVIENNYTPSLFLCMQHTGHTKCQA